MPFMIVDPSREMGISDSSLIDLKPSQIGPHPNQINAANSKNRIPKGVENVTCAHGVAPECIDSQSERYDRRDCANDHGFLPLLQRVGVGLDVSHTEYAMTAGVPRRWSLQPHERNGHRAERTPWHATQRAAW